MVTQFQMDDMQPIDMRHRIRELQSIPERDRTDAEWDELNELEIRTAPGNRDYDRQTDRRPGTFMGQGKRPDRNNLRPPGNKNGNIPPRPQIDSRPEGGRLLKRQHRRPRRPGEMPPNSMGMPDPGLPPIIVEIPAMDQSDD